jgi:cytochrome c oxidase subunit 2
MNKELLINLLYRYFLKLNIMDVKRFTLRNMHNARLEFVWTLVPTVVLVFLAVPSLYFLYQIELMFFDLADVDLVTIKVVGNQWFWTYELNQVFSELALEKILVFDSYLRSSSDLQLEELRLLETDHPLLLPAFTPIRFIITSSDVLHSFAIPSLGIKLDACPGRLNQVFTFINREGEFYGQCSEICGVQHGFMPIDVIALLPTAHETVEINLTNLE